MRNEEIKIYNQFVVKNNKESYMYHILEHVFFFNLTSLFPVFTTSFKYECTIHKRQTPTFYLKQVLIE